MSTPFYLPLGITVSLIRVNCRGYGGLRVYRDSEDNETISEVGTNLCGREEHFGIGPGDLLESLVLYTGLSGIVGIEFRQRVKRILGADTARPWLLPWIKRSAGAFPD